MTARQPLIVYQIDGFKIPHVTVSYMNLLLKPISDFFNTPNLTINNIYNWIDGLDMYIGEAFRRYVDASNKNVQLATSKIINNLSRDIVELSINLIRDDRRGDYVLPWDIKETVGFDQELSTLLNVIPQTGTFKPSINLPVIIEINGKNHSHILTCEFTFGLLIFSSVSLPNCYTISMFDQTLTPDFANINRFRYYNDPDERPYYGTLYSILIMGIEYRFKTTDFIQGFITGADWCGLNHRDFWRDFTSISYSENNEKILTPMTF
jgi:hypothetical protein